MRRLTLSNGLGWSPEGSVLYSVDTIPGIVFTRAYDPSTGACGESSVALAIDDGSPDGLCVDADGNLWIAIWGAGQVLITSTRNDLSPAQLARFPSSGHLFTVRVGISGLPTTPWAGPPR